MKTLILLFIFTLTTHSAWAQHTEFAELTRSKSYDYMATYEGYVESNDGKWAFLNLGIDHNFPNNVGSDTYSYIIKYASSFEPNDFYLDTPTFIIHMVAPGQYRRIGFAWGMLFYEDQIALMTDEDAEKFQALLDLNYRYHFRTKKHAENMIREIYSQDIEEPRIGENKSIYLAQRHIIEIARRYPFEERREYSGAEIQKDTEQDNIDDEYSSNSDVTKPTKLEAANPDTIIKTNNDLPPSISEITDKRIEQAMGETLSPISVNQQNDNPQRRQSSSIQKNGINGALSPETHRNKSPIEQLIRNNIRELVIISIIFISLLILKYKIRGKIA